MPEPIRRQLTPEGKQALSATIRALRVRLLRDLGDEAERRYRLSVSVAQAGLAEAPRRRRQRLEAWLDERVRAAGGKNDKEKDAARARFLAQAIKEAAATLLNRLVLLRHLEGMGLSRPAIVTGGWNSPGYQELRDFAPGVMGDETEGYATLLQLKFDDLAVDLPGLFGDVGLTRLFQVPPATLREIVDRLDDEALESAWTDDTTLGWVYQYWNDPEREALDAKINDGGKIAPHEIASKTQMFTERYMVEWLLQNSLGVVWLGICGRNGWKADAEKVLPVLEARRAEWRKKREEGEVALDALMAIEGPLEEAWKYYVPQPQPGELASATATATATTTTTSTTTSTTTKRRGEAPSPRPTKPGEDAAPSSSPRPTKPGEDAAPSSSPRPTKWGEGEARSAEGEGGPRSIREVRLLDPACGSGHFLCSAFDLLVLMYREEARHRGEVWADKEIAESILGRNLHGVDIDPRAVQIAAAGLYLKAKTLSREARPSHLNLVAPTLQLGNLGDDDPALVELRRDLKQEAGIPEDLTRRLVASLAGVDHLGTLLKVDAAVDEALAATNLEFERSHGQGDLFGGFPQQQIKLTVGEAKATVLDKLEQFLSRHSASEDLGLRLDGEQLAAGVRFVRLVREGSYDVVVGNPPYQGLSKTSLSDYVAKHYPRGKADLYAAFLERGLELACEGGLSALLTMRGWMFLGQYKDLREHLLRSFDLRGLVDLDSGAFDEVSAAQVVLSVDCSVFLRGRPDGHAVALRPTPVEDRASEGMTNRKRAGLLAQVGRYEFDPKGFEVIEGEPIVYWWTKDFLARYASAPKLGMSSPAKAGAVSGNHTRFVRLAWELETEACANVPPAAELRLSTRGWVRYVKGARGRCWIDPCDEICNWRRGGLEIKVNAEQLYGSYTRQIRNEHLYFRPGIAVAGIGASFSSRVYRWRAVFDNMAASVFPSDTSAVLCSMNATISRHIVQSLNPGLHFEISDVNRLPLFDVDGADRVIAAIDCAFAEHEASRESSVEFKRPGPSPWRYAQEWAQRAVDRPDGAPLPAYEAEYDPPEPAAFVSFAVGVALGRFGANGEGIAPHPSPLPGSAGARGPEGSGARGPEGAGGELKGPHSGHSPRPREAGERSTGAAGRVRGEDLLPHGILFLGEEGRDSLGHPACAGLHEAWKEHGAVVGEGDDLRTYLQRSFFDWHKRLYENRPIYFPLSSAKRSYVAFISIHRWQDDTLQVLLADHLVPERRRLEGELDDIRKARTEAQAEKKSRGKSEKRFAEVSKLLEELSDFIAKVTEVAEHGPPPPQDNNDKTPKRECDARFTMDLDDGVMVNSAALWPLLEAQWKDPKKWWKELATAQGRKDYDWSHLAARYFPKRVREKCVQDPSLAVAHKCFWQLHPGKAYAWELRLQDEIRPDFTIDEPGSNEHRARFLKEHPEEVQAAQTKEAQRRARKAAKAADEDSDTPLLDRTEDDETDDG